MHRNPKHTKQIKNYLKKKKQAPPTCYYYHTTIPRRLKKQNKLETRFDSWCFLTDARYRMVGHTACGTRTQQKSKVGVCGERGRVILSLPHTPLVVGACR
mmetsp:Transcript_20704/g.43310  ORF Transcript_20704/g.43310 Transcript_20704/m.43310 type:complete len:100 (+) Transcript_20704:1739-2038(+)